MINSMAAKKNQRNILRRHYHSQKSPRPLTVTRTKAFKREKEGEERENDGYCQQRELIENFQAFLSLFTPLVNKSLLYIVQSQTAVFHPLKIYCFISSIISLIHLRFTHHTRFFSSSNSSTAVLHNVKNPSLFSPLHFTFFLKTLV